MTEHEREITINNTEAHLVALRGEVVVVNRELESTLQEKTEAEARLATVNAEIEKATSDLAELYRKKEELESNFVSREANISQKEKGLDDDRAAFEKQKVNEQSIIDERKRKLDSEIAEKESQLTTLTQKLEELLPVIKDKENILVALTEQVAAKSKELNEINQQVAEATEDGTKRKEGIEKEIASKTAELKEIEDKITEQGAKVGIIKVDLEARENAVSIRERDVEVIIARLQKKWDEVYPGKKLNI